MILRCIMCFAVYLDFISSMKCPVEDRIAKCSDRNLTEVPHDLPENIRNLDLKNNYLRNLANYSFYNYTQLKILRLDGNRLISIEEYAFVGLTQLEELDLSSNELKLSTAYANPIFKPLISLLLLDIRNNVVENPSIITQYPYFGHLLKLHNLHMDLTAKPNFKNCGFRLLPDLKVIKFGQCFLHSMLNTTFSGMSTYVEELHFQTCRITGRTETSFLSNFVNLKVLRLFDVCTTFKAALKILYPFVNKSMYKIDLTRVNPGCHGPVRLPTAVIVTRKMMMYLQQICVKELHLVENGIVDFEPNSLLRHNYPECFEKIVFSRNRFSIIDGFKSMELLTFSGRLQNLTEFDYSYNPVSYMYNKANLRSEKTFRTRDQVLSKHGEMTTVRFDLSFKKELPPPSIIHFFLPPKIRSLKLSNLMQKEGIHNNKNVVVQLCGHLRNVDLSYFPLRTFPKLNFTSENNIDFIDLSGVDASTFADDTNLPFFKNSKTVKLRHTRLGSTLFYRGKTIFSLVPSVQELDISSNNIWFLQVTALSSNVHLRHLIMNYNLFSEIPIAVMSLSNLRTLEMQYNMLQTINTTIRNWLDGHQNNINKTVCLYLSGNVFKCSCENTEFIRWLFQTKIVFDKLNKNYKCRLDNGTVTDTLKVYKHFHEIFSNCDSGLWLRIGIILLSTFIVLAIPLGITINFRWRLAYWIYRKFQTVVEEKAKTIFVYDVYVSYGTDSLNWIKNILVSRLENSWKMKVCVEDRDILGGDVWSDAILESIQKSRNVIFVISRQFQERKWGNFEIQRAKFEKCTGYLRRIIVIKRSVNVEQIPTELGKIWNDITLVEWSDTDIDNSWDKLRMALFASSPLH